MPFQLQIPIKCIIVILIIRHRPYHLSPVWRCPYLRAHHIPTHHQHRVRSRRRFRFPYRFLLPCLFPSIRFRIRFVPALIILRAAAFFPAHCLRFRLCLRFRHAAFLSTDLSFQRSPHNREHIPILICSCHRKCPGGLPYIIRTVPRHIRHNYFFPCRPRNLFHQQAAAHIPILCIHSRYPFQQQGFVHPFLITHRVLRERNHWRRPVFSQIQEQAYPQEHDIYSSDYEYYLFYIHLPISLYFSFSIGSVSSVSSTISISNWIMSSSGIWFSSGIFSFTGSEPFLISCEWVFSSPFAAFPFFSPF